MKTQFISALAFAVALPTSAEHRYPAPQMAEMNQNNAVQVGYGYDSVKGELKPRLLVEGQTLELGNREQSFTLTLDTDQDTLDRLTSGASSLSASGWGIDFNIRGNFSKHHVSDEFSQTLTLVYKITEKDDVLAPELNNWTPYQSGEQIQDTSGAFRLTQFGAAQAHQDSLTRKRVFGNEVVNAIHYGAYLLATFKVKYKTREDKSTAMSKASVSGYGAEAVAEYIKKSGLTSNSVNMEITIKQVGGNGLKLAQAAAYLGGMKRGSGGEFAKDCGKNANDCATTMERILRYASGKQLPDNLTSFRDQLSCNNKQDCFAPIGFSTKKWSTSGHAEIMPDSGEWTLPLLTVEVVNIVKHQYAINRMDNDKAALIPDNQIVAITNRNMATLLRIADTCREDPYGNACGQYYKQESSKLEDYDRAALNR
ncbi:hypothetical protein [Hahella ganghwensis]|uniref:hypothetical protein n=1 Tax=Hahella ganghwensis TaxID=286420 RepID=UPI000380D790|nr:hypothetical protein [Hahella ganghwensis]